MFSKKKDRNQDTSSQFSFSANEEEFDFYALNDRELDGLFMKNLTDMNIKVSKSTQKATL